MKQRPILFQGAMVRALLDGSKTQTRRVVKLPVQEHAKWAHGAALQHRGEWYSIAGAANYSTYGQPGDQLWVRETFYCNNAFYPNGVGVNAMWREVDGKHVPIPIEEQRAQMLAEDMYYRADGEPEFYGAEGPTPWRPSIHMPRWASRITLEVVSVRIERLQEISEADAIAEGVYDGQACHCAVPLDFVRSCGNCCGRLIDAIDLYRTLWESINGPGSWDANPFVWVVEFKRVEGAAA